MTESVGLKVIEGSHVNSQAIERGSMQLRRDRLRRNGSEPVEPEVTGRESKCLNKVYKSNIEQKLQTINHNILSFIVSVENLLVQLGKRQEECETLKASGPINFYCLYSYVIIIFIYLCLSINFVRGFSSSKIFQKGERLTDRHLCIGLGRTNLRGWKPSKNLCSLL